MLSAFKLDNCRLSRLELDGTDDTAASVWVDLVEPEDEERELVQNRLGQNLATRPELEDIEASARFFEDADDHAGNSHRGIHHSRRAFVYAARA